MGLITAGELASMDYEWLNERFDILVPDIGSTSGRTVFTYLIDGFFNGCNNFHLAITLRIDSKAHTAFICCKSYQTQDRTVIVEYNYEKAVEIEKVFSQSIPRITDKRKYVYINGYKNYIMFSSGNVIDWHCDFPHEWKMYRDCIKELYDCIAEQYPMTYDRYFSTRYEIRLYSSDSGPTDVAIVKTEQGIIFYTIGASAVMR